MSRIAADYLAETLAASGVKRIYGVVGDSLNGLTDSLRRLGTVDWVHMRHEEGAAFAAGAEAQLTGQLAVCAGSCGPGNLHLINGLFDCQRSQVPVLAIAAHIPSTEVGIEYFQATHPEILFKECSHYVELVSSPEVLPQILARAMREAVSRRGVAVVVLSGDIALKPLEAAPPTWFHANAPLIRPTDDDVLDLADLLNASKRVTIMCGAAGETRILPARTRWLRSGTSSTHKKLPFASSRCSICELAARTYSSQLLSDSCFSSAASDAALPSTKQMPASRLTQRVLHATRFLMPRSLP